MINQNIKIITKKKTKHTNSRKTNFQPPQIVAQPKTIVKVPLKEKSISPERLVQHIDQVVQIPKSIVPKVVSEHVKKTLDPDDQLTRSKIRNDMQDIRRKKTAYADPINRPPTNQMKYPHKLFPEKTSDLDIDSLE